VEELMAQRRYHDVEPKLLAELRPGDRSATVRTVTDVHLTATSVTITWDDGTTTEASLNAQPGVEIVLSPGA
jgi:hypothetical protein